MDKKLFQGAGGGPTTTSDNLRSEDIVEFALAVSEGPIRGLSQGAKSFYVGETPLITPDGHRSFDKFAIGVHPGYPEGSAKMLNLKLGGSSSNFMVGVGLAQNVPVIRVTEGQLRGTIYELEVRLVVNRLVLNDDEGGTANNTAEFKIECKPAQAANDKWTMFDPNYDDSPEERFWGDTMLDPDDLQRLQDALIAKRVAMASTKLTVRGKTSSPYVKEFKVSVPKLENDDWMIRVTKLSPDNDEKNVVDLSWESYQATDKTARAYPNTAIVHGLGVANGQFSSLPEFGGVYDGLLVRVPSNYNPDTRTYDEGTPWNGSFKLAWTNNPAWILYDLIVNERYGLARHRRYIDANRFTFYQAAKWCDDLVPIAGKTEKRPRYTFNLEIKESRPGMELLNYVAGSFNALVWDDLQGQINLRVDKDDPAVQMFSPENVTEEGFSYTFTDITGRANDLSVSFINPDLDWNEDRRRIPNVTTNEAHIERFGRIPLDFIAVGCTNFDEALAKAQVRLISAQTETTMVSFTTARQGFMLSLYDIILVADPYMGWSQSGRLTTYDNEWMNFRDPIYIETMGSYVVKVQSASGIIEVTATPESIGHVNRLRLNSPLPDNLPRYTVFTIEGTNSQFGYAKPFRVMNVSEVDGSPYLYAVNAIEVNRNKYVQVGGEETQIGAEFDYSTKAPFLPTTPSRFTAYSGDEQLLVMSTGEIVARILAQWDKPFSSIVSEYVLQYRLVESSDVDWETIRTKDTRVYISPVKSGEKYTIRVAAVNGEGRQSPWATIASHTVIGKTKVPTAPATLTATGDVFQNKLDWTFGLNPAPDLAKTEIWASATNDVTKAVKLSDLSFPTNSWVHLGLDMNVTFNYWARNQDTSGNYSPWSNMATATTTKDANRILGILTDQLTLSQLHATLKAPINAVGPLGIQVNGIAADLSTETQARKDAVTAEVSNRTTALAALDSGLQSYVQNYTYAKATQDSTNASTLSTLRSEFASADTTKYNAAVSYVQGYAYTKAATDSAIAGQVNTVSARLNGFNGGQVTIESAMTANANAITGLQGQYTLKIQAGKYVAGFGVAVNGSGTSSFIIQANTFGVGIPGYGDVYPFVVGTVNGQAVVGINGALVIDGTLTVKRANIETAAVDTLRIAGNAVTVPVFINGFGGASNVTVNTGDVWLASVTATFADAVTLAIFCDWQSQMPWSQGSDSGVKVKVNGTVLLASSDSAIGNLTQTHSASAKAVLGAGTYTFELYYYNPWYQGQSNVGNWSMLVLGVMR